MARSNAVSLRSKANLACMYAAAAANNAADLHQIDPAHLVYASYDPNTGKQAWKFYTVPGDLSKPPENEAMRLSNRRPIREEDLLELATRTLTQH